MTHDTLPELEQMRMGAEYRFPVECRGFKVLLRPLTIAESLQAAANCVNKVQSMPKDAQTGVAEHVTLAKETLKFASQTDFGSSDPKLNDVVMDRWTSAELDFVFKQYVAGTDRCSPQLDVIPEDRLADLVEDIKKKPRTEWLLQTTELSFLQLAHLVPYLLTKGD